MYNDEFADEIWLLILTEVSVFIELSSRLCQNVSPFIPTDEQVIRHWTQKKRIYIINDFALDLDDNRSARHTDWKAYRILDDSWVVA